MWYRHCEKTMNIYIKTIRRVKIVKKEKKVFLACIALLLLTVLTVYVISGTYARYSSQITGTSTARAAKWAWKINNQDLTAGTTEVDLNLFETILSTDDIIAPGTKGKFTIKVQNLSEVKASYKYTLSQTNSGRIPIEYSVDQRTWTSDITTLNATTAKELAVGSEATDATIYWRWAIGESSQDAADTTIGFKGTDTVIVKATLQLTQVD